MLKAVPAAGHRRQERTAFFGGDLHDFYLRYTSEVASSLPKSLRRGGKLAGQVLPIRSVRREVTGD